MSDKFVMMIRNNKQSIYFADSFVVFLLVSKINLNEIFTSWSVERNGKYSWYPKWFFVLFLWFLFVYWGGGDFLEKIKIFIEVFSLKLSNLVKWLDLFIKTDINCTGVWHTPFLSDNRWLDRHTRRNWQLFHST